MKKLESNTLKNKTMFRIMNDIKNRGWIPNILTPALLIIIIFNTVKITRYVTEMESRTLSSIEMKVRLEDHMASWTPIRQERAFQRLSDTEKNIVLLKKEDSIGALEHIEIRAALKRIEKKIEGLR